MGFRNGAWMSVFGVYPKTGGITQILGSTSRKDKDSGEYVTDFSGYCSCIGNAVAQKALQIKPSAGHPVKIHLGDVEVKQTFEMGPDGKRVPKYTNFNIYSFEFGENTARAAASGRPSSEPANPAYEGSFMDDVVEEGLPF